MRPGQELPNVGGERWHDQKRRAVRRRHHQAQQCDADRWQAHADHALDQSGGKEGNDRNDDDGRGIEHQMVMQRREETSRELTST
jgi:hypothetical protein